MTLRRSQSHIIKEGHHEIWKIAAEDKSHGRGLCPIASAEQNTAAEQVNTAIRQLDQVIQQTATASEEMSATSEELAAQADQLQDAITFFRVDGGAAGISGHVRKNIAQSPRRVSERPDISAQKHSPNEFQGGSKENKWDNSGFEKY